MYLTKTIDYKQYNTKVQYIITSDIVKTVNRIHAYHRSGVTWEDSENPEGCTILCSMSKYYIVLNSQYLSHNTFAHELFHCTCNLAADRGIYEEEGRAWIQGFIAQGFYDFLKSKNITI